MSATSTLIVQQIATSTGYLVESSLPLLWGVLGLFVAIFAVMIIGNAIARAMRKLLKGRFK